MAKRFFLIGLLIMIWAAPAVSDDGRHGWPSQSPAKKLLVCGPGSNLQEWMLLESLSGLAAQAVNEGWYDTMLWLDLGKDSKMSSPYQSILERSVEALSIEQPIRLSLEEVIRKFKRDGVIRGYILYDSSDTSVNTATLYAAILKGVLIDRTRESWARKMGLRRLKDVGKESSIEVFRKYKSRLNNGSVLSIGPESHMLRDYAIAQKLMLYYNEYDSVDEILEWVRPLSPALGWGYNSELDATRKLSEWGLYNTATNYCINLPFISSAADKIPLKKNQEIEPAEIDFSSGTAFHAFLMSDGDNIQWSMASYPYNDKYMGHQLAGSEGLNWTMVPTSLSVITPLTWNDAVERVGGKECTIVEYGGGYQYPDLFAIRRNNRSELLRTFAKDISSKLDELNVKVFGFICIDVASEAAQEAFQIYAEEMTGITGMVAIQFFPYELEGEIYWKTNREGIDIPVMTTRYSLWNEINPARPRAGVPEFVSSLINRDVLENQAKGARSYAMTIAHAWSDYSATSMVIDTPASGTNSMLASEKLLLPDVRPVSINELLWRVRMHYRPEQTKKMIKNER